MVVMVLYNCEWVFNVLWYVGFILVVSGVG